MARIVLALTLLSLLCLPGLARPTPSPEDSTQPAEDSTKPAEKEATAEPKPSKKDLAKQALSRATEAHKEALEHADGAIKKLEAFIHLLDDHADAKTAAAGLEESAQKHIARRGEKAENSFQGRLGTLAKSGSSGGSKAVAAATKKANRAAKDVEHSAGDDKAKAMREQRKHIQKATKEYANTLASEAHEGARAAVKAAYALERAERHAGVKEDVYERALDRNTRIGEGMEDKAKDLQDKAEDKLEKYFDTVENRAEPLEDDALEEAAKHLAAERGAVRGATKQAGEAAEKVRAAEKKAAAEAKAEAKASKGKEASDAAEPTESAQKAKDDTKAADGASPDGANAGGASAGGDASTSGSSPTAFAAAARPVPLVGAAGLLVFAAWAVAFPAALRMRPTVREAPLLG